MSKREEQKREADRLFEECRLVTMSLSDERLCEVLMEVPHRKWLQLDKETRLAVGVVCRRAAERIKQLNMAVRSTVETKEAPKCFDVPCPYCGKDNNKGIPPDDGHSYGVVCSWCRNQFQLDHAGHTEKNPL